MARLLRCNVKTRPSSLIHGPPELCRDSPIINPLPFDEKATGTLPPTRIMVCGNDPLRDHSMLFKEKLQHLG